MITNKTQRKVRSLTAALLTLGSLIGGANAAVTVVFSDEGPNTRVTISGSVDTSGLIPLGTDDASSAGAGMVGLATGGPGGFVTGIGNFNIYSGAAISTAGVTEATINLSGVPSNFTILINGAGVVALPLGYISGTPIMESFLASGNLAGHGLVHEEAVSASWMSSTGLEEISFTVGSSVPEPSSAVMLTFGLGGIILRRRRM